MNFAAVFTNKGKFFINDNYLIVIYVLIYILIIASGNISVEKIVASLMSILILKILNDLEIFDDTFIKKIACFSLLSPLVLFTITLVCNTNNALCIAIVFVFVVALSVWSSVDFDRKIKNGK